MSSHDSISLALKCMLRGAADFLIKPIRKNELSNLWQHIWRRNNGNNVQYSIDGNEIEKDVKNGVKSTMKKEIIPSEYGHNKELNYQHSDVQRSCTKSDIGVAKEEKILDLNLFQLGNAAFKDSNNIQNDSKHLQLYSETATIPDINLRAEPLEDDCDTMNEDHDKTSRRINSSALHNHIQPHHMLGNEKTSQNDYSDISKELQENDFRNNSYYMPHVELMLGRCGDDNFDNQQNDETNVLNHSKSSAFSTYIGRTELPILLERIQCKEEYLNSSKTFHDQEYRFLSKAMDIDTPSRDVVAVNVSTVLGTAKSIPSEGIRFGSVNEPVFRPTFYQLPAHPFRNPVSLTPQEASTHENASKQHDHESVLSHYQEDNSAKSTLYQFNMDEKIASICTAESGSNSICGGTAYTTANSSSSNVSKASIYNGHGKLIEQVSAHFLSEREVALNRFRLKKKDRCFKKKVRYLSRKVIAEHRPRVKGQFVGKNRTHTESDHSDYSTAKENCSMAI